MDLQHDASHSRKNTRTTTGFAGIQMTGMKEQVRRGPLRKAAQERKEDDQTHRESKKHVVA